MAMLYMNCQREGGSAVKVRIAGKLRHSSVNGPGVRYVLFFQGCPHHCRACQNPETWDRRGGTETDTESLIEDILSTRYLEGLTLSGGDPLLQPEAAAEIAAAAKRSGLSVWAYTGWIYEDILSGRAGRASIVLPHLDVLVDGPFILARKDGTAIWRGSSNQRLIDVRKSLAKGRTVLFGEE